MSDLRQQLNDNATGVSYPSGKKSVNIFLVYKRHVGVGTVSYEFDPRLNFKFADRFKEDNEDYTSWVAPFGVGMQYYGSW